MIEKRGENAIPSEKLHLFEKSYNILCYLEHNLELRKNIPIVLTNLSVLWLYKFVGAKEKSLWPTEPSPD